MTSDNLQDASDALAAVAAGRAAADRLAHSWPDRSWVTEAPSIDWARGAIERFGELERAQPAMFRASRKRAEQSAESLSPRPFQGLVESLQNADDTHASELRVRLVTGSTNVLLIVHDGDPVMLDHAGAMLLPWLTTKEDEAEASGRFGIGQQTLRALGGPLEIHCFPFHFRLAAEGPEVIEPYHPLKGFYDPGARETLVVVPLLDSIDLDELRQYVTGLPSDVLLFLRHVRRFDFSEGADGASVATLELEVTHSDSVELVIGDKPTEVAWSRLRDAASRKTFDRYVATLETGIGERRRHKADTGKVVIGVAVPDSHDAVGRLYDRLPLPLPWGLPISASAPFDPDAARTTILPIAWNSRRLENIGDLVAGAAVDLMKRRPRSAWTCIPLEADVSNTVGEWVVQQVRSAVIEQSHARLVEQLTVPTNRGFRKLESIAFEAEALDGMLTDADTTLLAGDVDNVPSRARDRSGRWRLVLRALNESDEIGVERALALFEANDDELGTRSADWFVGLGSAAADNELLDELITRRSVLLTDGTRVEPPAPSDPRTLVLSSDQGSLGSALGIALELHDAYRASSKPAKSLRDAFRRARILQDDIDQPSAALAVLARDQDRRYERLRLSDEQLIALRDAFEVVDEQRQRSIGPRIGNNVELRGFSFAKSGERQQVWVPPSLAYLPSAIDRESSSFARAAATTPALRWVDPSYALLLRRTGGRRELGAQRFLVKLGAATQPRLVHPPDNAVLYARDPRPASALASIPRPKVQEREIKSIGSYRSHLLSDRWSPDLDAVMANIERDPNSKRRRTRGLDLLSVLTRAWERYYSEHQVAEAVYGYHVWQEPRDVVATWLARAAEARWLPNALGQTRSPVDLLLPTDANRVAYGTRRSLYLAPIEDAVLNGPAVHALRIRRGPSASSLVQALRDLSQEPITTENHAKAVQAYVLLSMLIPRDPKTAPVDDMTATELRTAFAGSTSRPGLVATDGAWVSPRDAFSGPPIFGRHRRFAPQGSTLKPLWQLLMMREPSAADCLDVLRELAAAPLAPQDVGAALDITRALARFLPAMTTQLRAQLARVPVWTSVGWTRERPVVAIEDSSLSEELGSQVPVWALGLTSFAGLHDLIAAMRLVELDRGDFVPTSVHAIQRLDGDDLQPRFAVAVQHLRDELAKGDPDLYASIAVPWNDLIRADVLVDPRLTLSAKLLDGQRVSIEATAHVLRRPAAVIIREREAMARADAAGSAIASLFTGDRQKVAWAWAAMWQRAAEGTAVAGVTLGESGRAADVRTSGNLLRLKGQASDRRGRADAQTGSGSKQSATAPVHVRPLKDLGHLSVGEGTLVNQGVSKQGIIAGGHRSTLSSRQAIKNVDGSGSGTTSDRIKTRTVLPPVSEREQLAFDAVRRALALDPPMIVDLRARRGIGADAMDELRQLFEIKMASGTASNEVTLTKAEAEAAEDPDFFLAVVEGLEDSSVPLRVWFIQDPLRRLALRISGDVTLSGVREVEALMYEFPARSDDPDTS